MQQYGMWYRHLPNVHPFYAVKCNPDPVLLKWLARRGVNFDCASARELYMVKEHIGGHGFMNRVLLANPCKTQNDIQVSKALGVKRVTVDSVEELVKMHREGYSPEVVVRLAVDDSGSACPFNAKFGLEPEKAEEVCLAAKSFNMSVVGLSFHVGSGSKDARAFRTAVDTSKDVWSGLMGKSLVGIRDFKVLDIGGGWSHEEAIFKEQAWYAKEGLKHGARPLETIAEPGRFFAGPVQDLYVKVVGKKPRAGGGWRYTLDESIYGQFSCIPFDHAEPKLARLCLDKNDSGTRATTNATFFGRTCDSLDWICNAIQTESLEVGDWLYVPNMGAYTTATATEFNGFPKPDMIEEDEVPERADLRWLERVEYPLASMMNVKRAGSVAEKEMR
jgi:ornithine decarboxylase